MQAEMVLNFLLHMVVEILLPVLFGNWKNYMSNYKFKRILYPFQCLNY